MNIITNFKNMKTIKKISSILSVITFLMVFILGIILATKSEPHYLGIYIIIATFSIPATFWGFTRSINDVRCAPGLVKIKLTTPEDKKVDAYFDYLEENNFSLFAPFVLLGMTIASFFIYTTSIKGVWDWNPNLPLYFKILFHAVVISYILYSLTINFIKNRNKRTAFWISMFFTALIIGNEIVSFYSSPTLIILTASLVIGFSFRTFLPLFAKVPKVKDSNIIEAEVTEIKEVNNNEPVKETEV